MKYHIDNETESINAAGMDWPLVLLLTVLMMVSVFVLYSATNGSETRMVRHFVHIFLAVVVMVVAAYLPSDFLKQSALFIYIFGVVLLLLVLLLGEEGKGAQRWINLGIRFQPSEIMKIAVPMMVASFLADKELPPKLSDVFVSFAIILLPMLLIIKQPDLGTALLVGSSGFFVVFFAGISWRFLATLVALLLIAAPLLFAFGMKDYQKQRVMTLINPSADAALSTGYHINQSSIAIGSGGIYGKGWQQGDQNRLDFLPERHTDFIFAVISEEHGLVGVAAIFFLYFLIITRVLSLAAQGIDTYARLLNGAFSLTFFVYLFVNTGMISGLLPVVGVPLPLVSYGGTSMLTLMFAFGLVMGLRRKKPEGLHFT